MAAMSFVARAMDRDPKHLREILKTSRLHKGSSFVEIYQNCNVFNDGAFFDFTEKASKPANTIFLEHNRPLVFGEEDNKGIRFDGFHPVVIDLNEGYSKNDLWIHDENDLVKAGILARFSDIEGMPRPFGVFYRKDRETYEVAMEKQIRQYIDRQGTGNLDELLRGTHTWDIS